MKLPRRILGLRHADCLARRHDLVRRYAASMFPVLPAAQQMLGTVAAAVVESRGSHVALSVVHALLERPPGAVKEIQS